MKVSLEALLICAAALALGTALGPLVCRKPEHGVQSLAPGFVETVPEREPGGKADAKRDIPGRLSVPTSIGSVISPAEPTSAPVTSIRLSRSAVEALADRCAPTAPAKALVAISRVESGLHPFRIRVNGEGGHSIDPRSAEEADRLASSLIASGKNIDLGLAQINSHNLVWLGLSVNGAFDPCKNLAAAGEVLAKGYRMALRRSLPGQSVLHTAYSLYNTGDPVRGISNGYADRLQVGRDLR